MRAVGTTSPRSAPAKSAGVRPGWRRILGRALQQLERLAAPHCARGDGELPPVFFKYPPV